jgi:hypothetical protein
MATKPTSPDAYLAALVQARIAENERLRND